MTKDINSEQEEPKDYPQSGNNRSTSWLLVADLGTSGYELERLAVDASIPLLERIAEHPNLSRNLFQELHNHPHPNVRSAITDNPNITAEIILKLCCDENPDVRLCIAENHNMAPEALKTLVNDSNPFVAERAKKTLERLSSKRKSSRPPAHFPQTEAEPSNFAVFEGTKNLKILVIEDNPADVRLLQKLLAEFPFDLKCADRLSTGLEYLARETIDLILLDLSLPDAQGIDTFYQVHCQVPQIPIVVLTGLEDESIGSTAVQSGAQDYLVKGQVLPGLLGRSIKYAIERHNAESKMKQLNDSLERRIVQLATANQELDKLAQALALSSEQALQASNFKSQFVAHISHELRTPLSAVLGITELLLKHEALSSNEETKGFVQIIDEAARSQLSLLNDILDLSKIEAGKVELENVDFSPVDLLEDIAQLFAASAAKKGVSLMTYADPALQPSIQGDSTRLREILINLTNNAIKFTPQGEVVLRVTKEAEDGGYVTARFSVTDSGIGISEQNAKQLFEPYVQSSNSRIYGGTGLGLSICKRLVDLMGGQIGVESKGGMGSSFWFSVRLKRTETIIFKIGDRLGIHSLKSNLPDIRVLVVNDNSTARDIIRRYIAAAGWRSDGTAANAEEALEMLHHANADNDAYSVAVIDLESSSPNSFELAAAIQQDPTISATHLIYLASIDQRYKGEEAYEAGFSAYLSKPIKQWNLLESIMELADRLLRQTNKTQVQSSPLARQAAMIAGNEIKVLVAEDNPVMRMSLVRQLEQLGVQVDSVANGREAVEAVTHVKYALVLMDCEMPLTTGLEATRLIRKLCADHTPIIAVTSAENKELCITAGMDQYLKKPVSTDQLRELLVRWTLAGHAKVE